MLQFGQLNASDATWIPAMQLLHWWCLLQPYVQIGTHLVGPHEAAGITERARAVWPAPHHGRRPLCSSAVLAGPLHATAVHVPLPTILVAILAHSALVHPRGCELTLKCTSRG